MLLEKKLLAKNIRLEHQDTSKNLFNLLKELKHPFRQDVTTDKIGMTHSIERNYHQINLVRELSIFI
jgi:hypothetical protein